MEQSTNHKKRMMSINLLLYKAMIDEFVAGGILVPNPRGVCVSSLYALGIAAFPWTSPPRDPLVLCANERDCNRHPKEWEKAKEIGKSK